jgi:hypothetical protein
MKETAVFDKPYVRKSAFVGVESFPEQFHEKLKSFSRREFPAFGTREEALDWLPRNSRVQSRFVMQPWVQWEPDRSPVVWLAV